MHAARGPLAAARVHRRARSLPSRAFSPNPPLYGARRSWRYRSSPLPGFRRRRAWGAARQGTQAQITGSQRSWKDGQREARARRPPSMLACGCPPAPKQRSRVLEGDATGRRLHDTQILARGCRDGRSRPRSRPATFRLGGRAAAINARGSAAPSRSWAPLVLLPSARLHPAWG